MIKIIVKTKKTGNIIEPDIMKELDNIKNVTSYAVEYDEKKEYCTLIIQTDDKNDLKTYLKDKKISITAEV